MKVNEHVMLLEDLTGHIPAAGVQTGHVSTANGKKGVRKPLEGNKPPAQYAAVQARRRTYALLDNMSCYFMQHNLT
jgi:hypothetical protein